jgi:hypothetical protein
LLGNGDYPGVSLIWGPIQGLLSVLRVLGDWEREKVISSLHKVLKEYRDDEAKVLRAFAEEMEADNVPENSHGEASPGGPGLPD